MLQKVNPPLEVVWEKGVLSSRLNVPTVPKSATRDFKAEQATVRTHRLNKGYDACVTVYYDRQSPREYNSRCMVSLYRDSDGESCVSFNGRVDYDDLPDMVRCIQQVQEKLNSLKS